MFLNIIILMNFLKAQACFIQKFVYNFMSAPCLLRGSVAKFFSLKDRVTNEK